MIKVNKQESVKIGVTLGILLLAFVIPVIASGQGYDNPLTAGIDEGAIGTGYDNPLTYGIDGGDW